MRNLYIILICFLLGSCKEGFLDAKPSTEIVIPNTLDDCQRLLENSQLNITSALPTLSADEYEFNSYEDWLATNTATERNAYVWAPDIFEGETERKDWNASYVSVFYANSVLSELKNIEEGDSNRYNYIQGWALLVRSFAFFDLVRNFAVPYDSSTAQLDLGIPLRLNPEVDEVVQRATVHEVYNQIVNDLKQSAFLLPAGVPVGNRNRPSKEAAFGLLAKVFLYMREYEKALLYADSCLSLYNKLIDYNTLDTLSSTPFLMGNEEVIYQGTQHNAYAITVANSTNKSIKVNKELLLLYGKDDLRRQLLYGIIDGAKNYFKRGYNQGLYPFSGIAVNEILLTRAECLARKGRNSDALLDINRLLEKRTRKGKYIQTTIDEPRELLDFILQERRKELVWKGQRWFDLIRLNKEGRNISLTRNMNGKQYVLPAGDGRWVFPIPADEVAISGVSQNKR